MTDGLAVTWRCQVLVDSNFHLKQIAFENVVYKMVAILC